MTNRWKMSNIAALGVFVAPMLAGVGSRAFAAPVVDGERDAGQYVSVASSPQDNLRAGDAADPRYKSLDAANLWAANTRTDLYLYVELPYLDLNTIAGEWGVAFHLKGANDVIQRTSSSDPYGASVDFGQYAAGAGPGLNVVLKSNMRGFVNDYDGNQGYAFLLPVNTAMNDWDWANGGFLSDAGWTYDTANNLIHGRGSLGGEVAYKSGKGIEVKIPLALFAGDTSATKVTAPKIGDTLLMQFYDNVRERTSPLYPRGPVDEVPFDPNSRTNPARGTLTKWASYALSSAGALEVRGAALRDVTDATHLAVSFSDPVGGGANEPANYQVVNESTGASIPVASAQVDAANPSQVILELALPFNAKVRVTAGGMTGVDGATLSDTLNSAEVTIGGGVVFHLYDPYNAYSALGNDPNTGQPYKITLTGDVIGWRSSADGSNEIPVNPVAGETGHYATPTVLAPPGVTAYKYRVPALSDAPGVSAWSALNPNDRHFYVPAAATTANAHDYAANNDASSPRNGGPVTMTFTLVDRDGTAAGRPVYLSGDFTGWSDQPGAAIPMPAVAGQPNTYRATFDLPAGYGRDTTTQYKYLLKPAAGPTNWDDLNPMGNRWAIFKGTGSPATQSVTDTLGGDRALDALRMAAGISPAPMWSAYYADYDLNGSGAVDIADALLARRGGLPLTRLKTRGTQIVDASGRLFNLRGTNAGGWFVEEMWMTPWVTTPPTGSPYAPVVDHVTLWNTITQRLGAESAYTVRAAYRNAWMRQADFPRIAAAGFNHIRLPFLYDLVDEPGGMDWLRNAVAWANAAGLYVILDLHGAPGSQNGWDHSGQAGASHFFDTPANIAKAAQVWTTVANEFAKNPGVAAFDLLNEPAGAPDANTLYSVSNTLYQAVRAAAPDTAVIIEDGYKGVTTFPQPSQYGWTNMIYSTHIYDNNAQTAEDHITSLNAQIPGILQTRASRNVPIYNGEFSVEPAGTADVMGRFLKILDDNGLHWAAWTYKTVAISGPLNTWGYYSNPHGVTPLNPFTDSAAALTAKMNQMRTENLTVPTGLAAAYQSGAQG